MAGAAIICRYSTAAVRQLLLPRSAVFVRSVATSATQNGIRGNSAVCRHSLHQSEVKHYSAMVGVKKRVDYVEKSEEDKRLYRGVELENGLKILLISDPETDKAAAAMDVHIGYMTDPKELPGLAHFCEHMLFLGTEKFPDENEYSKYLNQNGGGSNAFTSADHTNYYFDVSPDKLEGALDRFSQFFTCPLFTESATEREVNAVNSEHEKNISSDNWRLNQVEKATADPNHDYSKFGTGNKETLDIIPKANGLSVRNELLKFHNQWYSSNIMAMAVLGQQDLDTLEQMAVERVALVQDKKVKVPEWTTFPFTEAQTQTITYVVPVKDVRKLSVTWGVPDLSEHYKSSPGSYLGHLIGHEGPGSLLSELKARGWVNNLMGGQKSGSKGFGFIVVNVDLTEEGIDHIDDIVTLVFQYLAMLRKEGPQQWVWEECRDLNAMQFRFKDKERPQGYVCSLAGHLHDYPVEDVLTGGYLLSEWRPELISSLLDCLTPNNVRVEVVGQRYQDRCDQTEKWYGAKYKLEKLPAEKIEQWSNCGLHENLRLPDKNDFIPTDFSLAERDPCNLPYPTILQEDGLGRLWYRQDDEYLLPKTCINIEMKSPVAYSDPHHANLTYMFAMLFKDELNEYVYAAELAGLGYSLANTRSGISLSVKGYSDKQQVLLTKIMDKLTNFKVNEKRFEILKENYTRGLKNFQADQPHQHAVYYNSVLLSEKVWHKEELLECMDYLTVDEVQYFIPRLLASLKVECLIYGNCTDNHAKELYNYVIERLKNDCKTRPLLPSQLIKDREIQLTHQHSIYKATNAIHKSSCIETYFQCGMQDTRSNVVLELFAQIINESCYDQLRTKEQLGYIVFSGLRRSNGVQGLRFIVQSDKHPSVVDSRIEAYLAGVKEKLETMTEEGFKEHVEALATKRLEKPKKLSARNGRYWSEILSQHYNFQRDNLEVECLRSLSKAEVVSFYEEYLVSGSQGRRKLACHVVSTVEGGAGHQEMEAEAPESAHVVEDITAFKCSAPLYPLPRPFVPLEQLRRADQQQQPSI